MFLINFFSFYKYWSFTLTHRHEGFVPCPPQAWIRPSSMATTVGERDGPIARPTIANVDAELIPHASQGFPPLDAQGSLFLSLQLPSPHIQPLFVGLVGPLILHFLLPFLLHLRVLASHFTQLLLRHGMVAPHVLLGPFGLECLVRPVRFQKPRSKPFVVATWYRPPDSPKTRPQQNDTRGK